MWSKSLLSFTHSWSHTRCWGHRGAWKGQYRSVLNIRWLCVCLCASVVLFFVMQVTWPVQETSTWSSKSVRPLIIRQRNSRQPLGHTSETPTTLSALMSSTNWSAAGRTVERVARTIRRAARRITMVGFGLVGLFLNVCLLKVCLFSCFCFSFTCVCVCGVYMWCICVCGALMCACGALVCMCGACLCRPPCASHCVYAFIVFESAGMGGGGGGGGVGESCVVWVHSPCPGSSYI